MEEPTGFVALCLFAAVGFEVFSVRAQAPTRVALRAFAEKVTDEQVRMLEYQSYLRDKEPMHLHSDVAM
jgi:hypothetical protein